MERKGLYLIMLSVACYGSGSIFAKAAYNGGINLTTLLALRFSLAAITMFLYSTFSRTSLKLPPRDLKAVFLLGGVGYVAMAFLYFGSLQYIPVSMTALLTYTYPAIVTLLSYFFLKEYLDRRRWAALFLASVGCVLMVWVPGLTINLYGAAMALTSAVVYSVYMIAASRYTSQINSIVLTFYITLSSALVYTAVGIFTHSLNLNLSPGTLAAVVALGIIPTVFGNVFFFSGLSLLGASRTALISTVEPIYTVLMATIIFHEVITPVQMAGGLLIVTAVAVLNHRPREKAVPAGSKTTQG